MRDSDILTDSANPAIRNRLQMTAMSIHTYCSLRLCLKCALLHYVDSSCLKLCACALQSHASQKQCGLTSAVADKVVGLVQREASLTRPGEVSKLYGACSVGHAASGKLLLSHQ